MRPWRSVLVLPVLLSAAPSRSQQVIAHVPLLPREAGLNPPIPTEVLPDPLVPQVFVAHGRGASVFVPGGSPSLVNFDTGGPSNSYYPFAVLDGAGRRLYVSHGNGSTPGDVAVIDADTHAILASVPLPFSPGALFLDPLRQRVFVNDQPLILPAPRSVAVIDTAWLGVRSTTLPAVIGVNPATGKVYANDPWATNPDQLCIYNSDLTPSATLDVRDTPYFMTANEASGRVYVCTGLKVIVIDATTDQVIKTIDQAYAYEMVVDPVTGNLYYVGGSDRLGKIDTAYNKTELAIGGTPVPSFATGVRIDPAGRQLFVYDWADGQQRHGRVTVFDISIGTPVRVGAYLGGSAGGDFAWSPRTGRLYVSSQNDVTLHEVDTVSLTGTRIQLGASLHAGVTNPAAGLGFYPDLATDRVATVRLSGTPALLGTATIGAYPSQSALSAPRSEAYFVSMGTGTLSVLDATLGSLLRTVPLPDTDIFDLAIDTTLPSTKGYVSRFAPKMDASDLTLYEPGNGDATRGIACGAGPCVAPAYMAVNESLHHLYVYDAYAYVVHVYDTRTDLYIRSLGLDGCSGNAFGLDPATGQIYIGGYGYVCGVTDATPPVVTRIPGPDSTNELAFANGSLYAADPYDGSVLEVKTADNSIVRTIPTGGFSSMHAQPETGLLWVSGFDAEPPSLRAFDANGLQHALPDLGGPVPYYLNFAMSPMNHAGAGRLALANNRHGSIAVIDPTLGGPDFQIGPDPLPGGTTASAYPAITLSFTGGVGPVAWEVTSGSLPPGLVLNPATGAISGTPSQVGMFSFLVRATDNGQTPPRVDVEDFQIQVLPLRVVTTALPDASCGALDVTLAAAGGRPPYTWSVQGTGLPSGLVLDAQTGRLTGSPLGSLSCPRDAFTVAVKDANATTATATLCLTSTSSGIAIGNALRATRTSADVVFDLPGVPAPLPGDGFNFYRSADRGGSWERLPTGSTGTLPPTTTNASYTHSGGVSLPPGLAYYRALAVDACGNEGPD